MRLSTFLPALLTVIASTRAALKTSIYIDQIAGYSALAPCAENRVSAIVRAQASGCGDDQQLTSFSCFCVDQSTQISSVISTAVQEFCIAQATTPPANLTAPLPEVTDAIAVFDSYCARSTELSLYQAKSVAPVTVFITATPSSSFVASASPTPSRLASETATSRDTVPVAAIAAPVVVGVFAIAGVVGLLFFLRRRKAASQASKDGSPKAPPTYTPESELEYGGVHEVQSPRPEMTGDVVKYRYELETQPAEMGTSPRVQTAGVKSDGVSPAR